MRRYAYIHGFASGPLSSKGVALSEVFQARGLVFERPDLNQPSFGRLTFTGAMGAMDAMIAAHPDDTWCLIGSSMGGYLSALYAQNNPERIERLVLLCPGFEMRERWRAGLGEPALQAWEGSGHHTFVSGAGVPTPVHFGLMEDAARYPGTPEVPCPTVLIHGTRDEVVPIEVSRAYAATRPHVSLIEVDDEHRLIEHVHVIVEASFSHFGI